MVKNDITKEYSFKTGLKKIAKNILITYAIPAAVMFLESFVEIVPAEYKLLAGGVCGAIAYGIKNYRENK